MVDKADAILMARCRRSNCCRKRWTRKRVTVLVDSGFRRGSDVVKALALGAHAVQIGRGTRYGVAVGGEAGVRRAIAIYREEIDRVLALPGCTSVAALGTQYLHIAPCAVRRVPQSSLRDRPNLRLIDSEQAVAGE